MPHATATDNRFPLPHGLRLITDVAGAEVAPRIALARRGYRLTIPREAEGSVLEEIVGAEAASEIVSELRGAVIDIPLAKKLLAFWLRDVHGWSVAAIANRLGIAPRTLQYWFTGTTPERDAGFFDQDAWRDRGLEKLRPDSGA